MNERNLEQMRDIDLVVVHELFQVAHQTRHMLVMWWDKRGMFEADTDPVLTGAKFSWLFVFTPALRVATPRASRTRAGWTRGLDLTV